MSELIDISGLSKAEVFAALYNAARPQGLGFLHYDPKPMTTQEAQETIDYILAQSWNRDGSIDFDYHKGRVMKVEISGDTFNPRLFDRDNGQGAAARSLEPLRLRKAS